MPAVDQRKLVAGRLKAGQSVFGSVNHEACSVQRNSRRFAVPTNSANYLMIRSDARVPGTVKSKDDRAHAGPGFNRAHFRSKVCVKKQQTRVIESPSVGVAPSGP